MNAQIKAKKTPGPKLWKDDCGCFHTLNGAYYCDAHLEESNNTLMALVDAVRIALIDKTRFNTPEDHHVQGLLERALARADGRP